MEAWWNNQNSEEVYYIATFDWSGIGVNMPFATEVYGYYNAFGNGYVPFFGVIGASNILMYGDNYQTGAVAAVPAAIASFTGINVINPVADLTLEFGETATFDVSGVFAHADGVDFTIIVDDVANPSICDVTIDGDILTVTANNIMSSTEVTLRAIANDGENGTDTFVVDVRDPSLEIIFSEDFSGGDIPAGWEMTTNSAQGWWITADGSSAYWAVPTGDGNYACSNDDEANDDGGVDYLITPSMDFSAIDGAILSFDSYFTAEYSQTAHVLIRENGGAWDNLLDLSASTNWETVEIALGDYAGVPDVQILFHSNDNGAWASGWAIDNVQIEAAGGGSEDPIIDVSVSDIIQVGPGTQTFEISNVGATESVLSYVITSEYVEPVFGRPTPHPVYAEVVYFDGRDEEWLTIEPAFGELAFGATDEIILAFNDADLEDGDYHAEITVTSNGGDDVIIPVTLTVDAGNNPADITFNAWILERPAEVVTETTVGCGYGDPLALPGYLVVQCGSFESQWNAGETLHIVVTEVTTGYVGIAEIVLTTDGFQLLEDPIMVQPVNVNEEVIFNNASLMGNYPNPFSNATTISFSIKDNADASLEIFNLKGQLVKTLTLNANSTSVEWDASNQASGVYLYKMKSNGRYTSTKKMILLK
ncbi:MAG: T9SS type A sorting domain-containing protein [Candidatus Cloacimonetes bacterium]|jgi:hypothetical protein|nr:T9SS type A sorting domain-containing protein [Candidatus Cloacimonadota bacterium]MBT6993967.1 T9SS type A sorting domain-containing protein [Candidatus Cloacimonadota bacterium]MBT7470027.1 T9SS type A sorting domain-containing protein [Candidatus Cloacimonadota bacterium]